MVFPLEKIVKRYPSRHIQRKREYNLTMKILKRLKIKDFTTKSPGGPGTHFIDLREMKRVQRPCLICSLKTENI